MHMLSGLHLMHLNLYANCRIRSNMLSDGSWILTTREIPYPRSRILFWGLTKSQYLVQECVGQIANSKRQLVTMIGQRILTKGCITHEQLFM